MTLCSLSTISGIITEANCEKLFRAAERLSKHELKQFVEDMKAQTRRDAEEAVRRAEAENMPLFTGVAESGGEVQGAVSSEVVEAEAESAQQEQSSASVIETTVTEPVQSIQSIEARTTVGGSVERQTFALIPYQIPESAFA